MIKEKRLELIKKIVNDKNVMGKLIDITRKIMKQRDVLKWEK